MPIIGLTTQGASFPQIGVLRKGAPAVQKQGQRGTYNTFGADLDHFRFDTDDDEALAAFVATYGSEPKAINVYLPFPSTEQNFESWRENWGASGLNRRCDGQTCVMQRGRDGRYVRGDSACWCAQQPEGTKKDLLCGPVGRLKVIIPELRRLAYVTVLTHSLHDIRSLHEQILAIELMNGTLQGVPFVLRRAPREISTPRGEGQRARVTKHLLSIEAAPRWVGLQLTAMEAAMGAAPQLTARQAAPMGARQLAAPVDDGDDDDTAYEAHLDGQGASFAPPPSQVGDAESGEVIELDPPAAKRDTAVYSALGRKLTSKYGYAKDALKERGVLWTAGDIATMSETQYKVVIGIMQEMERDAIKAGKGVPVEEPAL